MVTDDGYILNLSRIPGKKGESVSGKPAVLFVHAQDCDMMEYLVNTPDTAPALVLANLGYDVWLGNNRGNRYSLEHTKLNVKKKAYWDFYQEDMARQDAPAFINKVLAETGRQNLTYIGHSEGTTQFFMGASLLPDFYAEKVNLFVALAPVASTANIPIWYVRFLAHNIGLVQFWLIDILHMYNLLPPLDHIMHLAEAICDKPIAKGVCKDILSFMQHDEVDDPVAGATFLSHEPSGAGYRTFVYYAQMINSARFELYDYGRRKNKDIYG